MGTNFRTVPTFLTTVTTLNDTTTELHCSLLDNQAIVLRIDTVARTSYLEQWEKCREEFCRIVEMSKGAAIKFSANIRYYLSLQEESNDPEEVDDTIKEISAFCKKLPQLSLDQTAEFDHLDASLEKLGKEIFSTVYERRSLISSEVDDMTSHVTSLEEELHRLYEKRRQRQCKEVLEGAKDLLNNGSNLFNAERRVPVPYLAQLMHTDIIPQMAWTDSPTRHLVGAYDFEGEESEERIVKIEAELRDLRGKLLQGESQLQEYEDLNLDQLSDVIAKIRENLAEQAKLQECIFSGIKTRLTDESKSYVKALNDSRVDLSPTGQLAYRNAKQHILSSSNVWERKADVLVDEYAKKLK